MRSVNITDKKFSVLLATLIGWQDKVRHYKRVTPDDTLVWYGERAQVGTLAAAAWATGGTAVEEWGCKKPGLKRRGRVDLYVSCGPREFIFEAKHRLLNVGPKSLSPTRIVRLLSAALQEALRAARRAPRDECDVRAALVFVTICVAGTVPLHRALHAIDDARSMLVGRTGFTAWAPAKPMRWPLRGRRYHVHPGVLVFGQAI